jgi:hypothetical protein
VRSQGRFSTGTTWCLRYRQGRVASARRELSVAAALGAPRARFVSVLPSGGLGVGWRPRRRWRARRRWPGQNRPLWAVSVDVAVVVAHRDSDSRFGRFVVACLQTRVSSAKRRSRPPDAFACAVLHRIAWWARRGDAKADDRRARPVGVISVRSPAWLSSRRPRPGLGGAVRRGDETSHEHSAAQLRFY